jgi:hypothetical protein
LKIKIGSFGVSGLTLVGWGGSSSVSTVEPSYEELAALVVELTALLVAANARLEQV